MTELYGVIGPLEVARPHRPGPYRCGCNPSYGQSCLGCDGSDAERGESSAHRRERESREAIPPCLLPAHHDLNGGAA